MPNIFQTPAKTLIKLKGTAFAEYNIIYRINDCFSVTQLSDLNRKNHLLFQKFENKNQQMNLVLVDSYFPIILADLALEVFINKLSSFNEYIVSNKSLSVFSSGNDKQFLKQKFFTFMHHLLYSEIGSNRIYNGEARTDKIYCLNNDLGERQFYTIFEQHHLQLMLLDRMKLEINLESSSILKEEVGLNFRIGFG